MSVTLQQTLATEHSAIAATPQPLPRPEGDRRIQAALDDDRHFRRSVLAAFIVAVAAGSGFGRLAGAGGWMATALWCIMAAGFVAHCISPRNTWRRGVADAGASRAAGTRLAGLAAGFVALASLRGGADIVFATAAVAATAAVTLIVPYTGRAAAFVVPLLLVGAGAGLPWVVETSVMSPWIVSVSFGIVAAVVAVSSRGADGSVNATLAVTRLSGIGYACVVWRGPGGAPVLGAIVASAVIMALEVLTIRRQPFAAVAVAVAVIHLGALQPAANLLGRDLPLQIVAATLEFLLLVVAGFRHVQASLWRFPSATYRVVPLCIVPRLDRAWDHPVKINVV